MESFSEFLKKQEEEEFLKETELLSESEDVLEESWLGRNLRAAFDAVKTPFVKWSKALFRLLLRKKLTARNLIKTIKKFSKGKQDAIVEFRKVDFMGQYTTALYIGGEFCMACVDDDFFIAMKKKRKSEDRKRSHERLPSYRDARKNRDRNYNKALKK